MLRRSLFFALAITLLISLKLQAETTWAPGYTPDYSNYPDTNKTGDNDSHLCWVAVASNLLKWGNHRWSFCDISGNPLAGVDPALSSAAIDDDWYSYYKSRWTNGPQLVYYGLRWIFEGEDYSPWNIHDADLICPSCPDGASYLEGSYGLTYIEEPGISTPVYIQNLLTNAPVGVKIHYPDAGETHVITCYGIEYQNLGGGGVEYKKIYYTDSDEGQGIQSKNILLDGTDWYVAYSDNEMATHRIVELTTLVPATVPTFTINPTHGLNGSIYPDTSFMAEYHENVTFYATYDTGYEVDKWYVNGEVAFTGGDNIVLGITGPTTVHVTFKPVSSNTTLTINATGSGQVKVDGVLRSLPWQGTYASGTVINLQAIQSTGWTFGYWSGVISSTSNPINVQLNNGGTITANFLNTANTAEVSFNLEPSADAYVSSYRPANNYGSENSLLVGCEQISTVLYSYESLIKFNLPTIGSGTSIKDAWLKLTNSGGMGYLEMSVRCNSGSWSESGVTWNNKPSYYTLPKTSINISGNDGFGTTYLLPVQLHLNEWINNSRSNNGFRLTYSAAAGNNYSFIQASETSYNSPPELSFTVYETISNPTSISGVTSGSQGDSLSFAAGGASSNLNHSLQYRFDWGDGDQSSWGSASRSKTYTAVGQYGIRSQARCSIHTDAVSNWSPVLKTVAVAASSRSISGYVRDSGSNGIASVTVFANNGGDSTATNSSGYYNLNIPYNWSGRITPMKTGVEFSPIYKEYSFVTSNQTNQNYTGISCAVQVIITPFLASDDGAMWRIDGGTWRLSGYTEENLSSGTHTVDFLSTTNWNAPDSRTMSITGSQSIAAHYYHIADLDTDDKINLSDYSLLSVGWQDSPCSSPDWCGGVDINRSGTVGIDDLLIMAEHWLDGSIVSEGTSLLVANHSFEEPIIDPSTNPMLSIPTVSSWVEHDTDEILGGNVGIFLNLPSTNPASILNVDGNQLAFLGSGLGNTLIQHLSATYQVGKRYQMTVSIGLSPDYPPLYQDILYLYLFYVDPNTLNWINISSSTQPAIGFRVESLKDCSLYLPTVTANEPWAGANIGIMIQACGEPGGGWNLDNVRVTELDGMLGNGTESEPFLVSSCHHLQEINDNPSAYYKLMNDIDLSGNIYSESVISFFSGHFDGQGHTISNLAISGSAFAGLFGQIEPAGEVKNLVLENININGFDFVGSLCGYNNGGIILHCNSSGSVKGTFHVGGLCGINDGTMVRCYSSGIVEGIEGPNAIGGLVGGSGDFGGGYRGSIIDCYSTSSVIGSTYSWCLGGLCGAQDGELRNCYSMGTVVVGDSSMNIGGLCGMGNEANATNCYWDVQSSGIGNPGDNNYGAIGKTTAEMKIQSTFAGWDFINIWNIGEGDGYPYLR